VDEKGSTAGSGWKTGKRREKLPEIYQQPPKNYQNIASRIKKSGHFRF